MDLVYNALKLPEPPSRLNFQRQTPCVPTPTDSDAVAAEQDEEEEEDF